VFVQVDNVALSWIQNPKPDSIPKRFVSTELSNRWS